MDSDKILLRQLKMTGYPNTDQLPSFANFNANDFIKIIYFISQKIPSIQARVSEPPSNPSQQYKYANSLVQVFKSIDYPEQLRYDHFLYPKQENIRSIFSYLLERIPRQGEAGIKSAAVVSPISLAAQAAFMEFSSKTPPVVPQKKIFFQEVPINPNSNLSIFTQAGQNKFATLFASNDREANFNFSFDKSSNFERLKTVARQTFSVHIDLPENKINATPVLPKSTGRLLNQARFEFNENTMKKGVASVISPVVQVEKVETDDTVPKLTYEQFQEIKNEQKGEVKGLKQKIQAVEEESIQIDSNVEVYEKKISEVNPTLTRLTEENRKLSDELESTMKVVQLASLPDTEIKQLQKNLIASTHLILEIAKDFDPPRQDLIDKYRKLSSDLKNKNEVYQREIARLQKLNKKLQEGEEKLIRDTQTIEELKAGIEDQDQELKRTDYLGSIFQEIQKIENDEKKVEAIRADIHTQHQKLNKTIDTVKRTWALLDETIYSEAKKRKDQWIRGIYKTVVDLLSLYEGLSEDVEEGGRLEAQIMELQSKVVRMETQIDEKALQRLEADLKQVLQEIDEYQ